MPPYRTNSPLLSSPTSIASSPPKREVPAGFLPSSRNKPQKLELLSRRELLDIYNRNKRILDQPAPSTSSYHQRLIHDQATIEGILGVEIIQDALSKTHITEDDPMGEPVPSSPPSRTVDAKRRALARFYTNTTQKGTTRALGLDEAVQLEQQAHMVAAERQKQEDERRRRQGLPVRGEVLSNAEREAKIWAFMNAKPSESDEEDVGWNATDSEDEDDPSNYFDYSDDEEAKGHPLVDPDELADLIRVDTHSFSS
ncbi:hypothetical protein M422DRAFT_69341 [Sphaerobolus stellatus SS14]|uniref:Uncharacterized protein n=1 Tax=Sphaerobolus stellatus (strain SS14) TaxID=990650 RepID=A0A0C9VJC0_SPHS4|nr:hypothetical protein M422DRAFT_69341 [Sphaerobolus stellatus SS14]